MTTDSPKTVLVTGAAKRLGRAIALKLAGAGWSVAVHCRESRAEAAEVANAVTALGVKSVVVEADLAREDETAALVPASVKALGPLTGLVNNASLFENDNIANVSRASWESHIAVNLRAPVVLAQAFAAQLPQNTDGVIINLLDQRLLKPTPNFLSYGVSKAALGWLTLTLAQGLAPRIRVNAVAPGPTLPSARQSPHDFKRQTEAALLGHGATPDDIAAATHYLMDAHAVTGQTITVDGGQHLIWKAADTSGIKE